MPFVQGQLQNRTVRVTFTTECAHCSQPLTIEMDSDLGAHVREAASPLIFVPHVDFATVEDPSIVDVF